MNAECAICNEIKIMTPCMALNNCQAMVCKKCKDKMPIEYGDMFNPKCMFCFTNEYYRDVIVELNCDIFGDAGGEQYEQYVIVKYKIKYSGANYIDYNYCWDCDE